MSDYEVKEKLFEDLNIEPRVLHEGDVLLLKPDRPMSRRAIQRMRDTAKVFFDKFSIAVAVLPAGVDAEIIRVKNETLYEQVKNGVLK